MHLLIWRVKTFRGTVVIHIVIQVVFPSHYEDKQKLTVTSRSNDFTDRYDGDEYGQPHKKTRTDPSGTPARGNGHADQIAGSARFSPGAKPLLSGFYFFTFFFSVIRPSYQAYFKWHVAPDPE